MNELHLGQEYILSSEEGGVMSVGVERFDYNGNVAVLVPMDPAVRAWFKYGYPLARTQWHRLQPVHER